MPLFSLTLRNHERLAAHVRQTENVLVPVVIVVIVAIYAPLSFLLHLEVLRQYGWFMLAWTAVVAAWAVYRYVLWLLNSYIITTDRIISVQYHTLFKKYVREMELSQVARVSYETTGFFSSILGFGTVRIGEHGSERSLVMKNVSQLENIKAVIYKAQHIHKTLNISQYNKRREELHGTK